MALPRLLDGLAFRVGLLLTVALFPIGLIAISLTRQVEQEEDARAESAILALTAEAAASEESFMRAGASVAGALAAALPVVRQDPVECNGIFETFQRQNPQYVFAGFIDPEGKVQCGSSGGAVDLSTSPVHQQMLARPEPRIDVSARGRISNASVIILSQPVFDAEGAFDGYVAVSIPNQGLFRNSERFSVDRPIELVTFNDEGAVLSTESKSAADGSQLPRDRSLKSFVGQPRTAFTGETVAGEKRVFAVVPIISDTAYALGSWPVARIDRGLGATLLSPLIFASLMWLVSLGVAYLAVHRLAIRNISELRARMQSFSASRRLDSAKAPLAKPLEFREIDQTWEETAATVVREEAELENIIHTRTVLLKEVHHRVKNNLQLIASIVSMKIRKATAPEARTALKEVQMRVMSIATVHRALYSTSTVGHVQADELLKEIVDKTIEAVLLPTGGIRIETSYEPTQLYPDQAVPLSLLAAEAITNAVKYVGRPADGTAPWITLRLLHEGTERARLEVANSRGAALAPVEQTRGTGLGASLIQAFAGQMHGSAEVTEDDPARYAVRVSFPIVGFDADPVEAGIDDGA
ncbi:sensor histidine kinase [Frigidibacter sp. ROC022]|uniref:sensor histidine kinase n=1 Tax=Frigidibacter sp. ROC022 TaxID=2971796 RepID=UPI00215B6057|nr:sensor histidine kinase [Frigidibacter sp. ROC022]MCR8723864.1 sensor histidine kinase [Frigidibacter sp. ROC022]